MIGTNHTVDENNDPAGIDHVHEHAALALEFMRDRIAEAEG